jgi:hypothetical protein
LFPVGCNWIKSRDNTTPQPSPKKNTPAEVRPAADYVAYLNRQAGYVQTVKYNDLNLSVTLPGQSVPGLNNGWVVCGKPNNFRMNAGLVAMGTQLDVGSNAQELWMYVKPSDPQYTFCSHADFPKYQDALPVKFEPAWVLQALGMAEYDPARRYEVRQDATRGAVYLTYPDTTATGDQVLKVTEFAASDVSGTAAPQVRRHLVLTPDRSQVIASATVTKVAEKNVGTDPVSGGPAVVKVPTEVVLEWPQQKVKLELQLGQVTVNERMTPDQYDRLFRRPAEIRSAKPVNLADYLAAPRGRK